MFKREDGFTLMELVVIIVIIGILGTSTVFSLGRFNKMNADAGIESLSAALSATRAETLAAATDDVYLEFKQDGKNYTIDVMRNDESIKSYKSVSSKFSYFIRLGDYESATIQDMKVYFNRGDGSLHQITLLCTDGSAMPDTVDMNSKLEIISYDANKYIVLSPLTGRGIVK